MPLPPALLAKLAKRGLLDKNKTKAKPSKGASAHQNEEIIAEDYDDVEEPYPYDYEPVKKPQENFWSERLKRRIVDGSITGYKGCPNKYNIYHKCTLFCMNTYGDGITEPRRGYLRRKSRLLKKHPLPKDWKEVYDHGCGVHYYWNTVDDTVSWLPPSHPKAAITKSAASLRKELEALLPEIDEAEENNMSIFIEGMNIEFPIPQMEKIVEPPEPPKAAVHLKKPKARDLEKTIRARTERRQRADIIKETGALDPMDPAAYSDVPRGKWSAGLEHEGEKTGVDSTVTGTLFQMRPYPSPGMVLQANAAAAAKKSKSGDSSSKSLSTAANDSNDDDDDDTDEDV